LISNSNVQNLDIRVRLSPLLLQHFEHTSYGLADIVLQFINRLALRIATRKRWDLAPKTALGIFVDDNGVCPHIQIFAQAPA
jgi:hypothetical protein